MYKKLIISCCLLFSTYAVADRGLGQITTEIKSENRVALVIGNNAYQHRPLTVLNNTINDAKALRSILHNRGFEVLYRENISHREFDAVLEKFYQKLRDGGVGLLYFSGHGMEFEGQNYLIPTNAKIGAKSDVKYEAVALNKITHRIQKIGNRLNIVILDACRNNPFAKAYGVGGLVKTEPIGLFVSYATGAGKISSDGRVGGNGLFTQYLIKYMQQPLNLPQVFKKTRKAVYQASSSTQFPAIYDQTIDGDFYFTLPTQPTYPPPPQPTTVHPTPTISTSSKWMKNTREEVTWKKAKEICRAKGGRLPTIEELRKVVTDCGGEMKDDNSAEWKRNEENSSYQSCYKAKGFTSNGYWSSTTRASDSFYAWVVYFHDGDDHRNAKTDEYSVRCVRGGH